MENQSQLWSSKELNSDFESLYCISTHTNPIDSIPAYNSGFYHLKHFHEHLAQYLTDIQIDIDWYILITSKFLTLPDSVPIERYNLLVSLIIRCYTNLTDSISIL